MELIHNFECPHSCSCILVFDVNCNASYHNCTCTDGFCMADSHKCLCGEEYNYKCITEFHVCICYKNKD